MKKPELHDAEYWKNRPLTPDDKDWIDDQPNWIESYFHSTNHPHRQLIVDAIKKISPIHNLLEIGCNTGSNLLRIHEVFPKIELVGIDVNKKCIKRAEDYLEWANLKVGDCRSLPFPREFFDATLADAVLMYINPKEIQKAILELDRVSRKAIIIVDRFSKSKKGVRNGHVWARNYKVILEDLGYKTETTKITEKDWPYSIGWQRFGHLFVATK